MEKNVIQINGGITLNVDVSVKKFMYVKKIMFGIPLHVIVKMENISSIRDKIICDKIIDIKETNFNEKNITCQHKVSILCFTFY